MSKHRKHSTVITLLNYLPLARYSYQVAQSLAVLYEQLGNLARDRSDLFQMQEEKSKQKNKPAKTTNTSLRRKRGIKGVDKETPCRSQGKAYILLRPDLNLSYSLGWFRGEVLGRRLWKVAMRHRSYMHWLWRLCQL